jgi:hypothetical protein
LEPSRTQLATQTNRKKYYNKKKILNVHKEPSIPTGSHHDVLQHVKHISKQATRAVIGVMHVNRSLPSILAFTGTKLLGLRLRHHYCTQGISHIKQVIQHTRQQDKNGKMYRIILDFGQLLARVHYPILQHPTPKLPHIKDTLIATICQFLADSQLNIVYPKHIQTKTTLWERPEQHE